MPSPCALALALALAGAGDPASWALDGRVEPSAPTRLRPGERAELSLTVLEPVERGVPLEVWLDGGPVTFPENRLGWRHVVDVQAVQVRMRAEFVAPGTPGEYEIGAEVFWIGCDADRCRSRHAKVRWSVVVAP